MPNKKLITQEEAAELHQLYADYQAAVVEAGNLLRTKGMESEEFRLADQTAGIFYQRIREILGTAGEAWNA